MTLQEQLEELRARHHQVDNLRRRYFQQIQDLKAQVREVRDLQRQYFRSRDQAILKLAKKAEAKLDHLVGDSDPQSPGENHPLFPEGVP